jgi:dipeptidase E
VNLVLTSGGVRNTSIENAVIELLGKPIAESTALIVPTGIYPMVGPGMAWRVITGRASPLSGLGWKTVGVLELTALPSLGEEKWVPWVRAVDALLVAGGDSLYLAHWMRQSGLADLLPSLSETVYIGVSGGSMALTPNIGNDWVEWIPPAGGDTALGVVDFSIFPHLDNEEMPWTSMAHAEEWAAGLAVPAYAIDDETAITVTDGAVEVISEGHWRLFTPNSVA